MKKYIVTWFLKGRLQGRTEFYNKTLAEQHADGKRKQGFQAFIDIRQ